MREKVTTIILPKKENRTAAYLTMMLSRSWGRWVVRRIESSPVGNKIVLTFYWERIPNELPMKVARLEGTRFVKRDIYKKLTWHQKINYLLISFLYNPSSPRNK